MKGRKELIELSVIVAFVVGCHATRQNTAALEKALDESIALSAAPPAASQAQELPAFDKQGHRGARGLMPENTIPAMTKAIDLGVTTLEMDVVISKDKKVVLSHDAYFSSAITTKPNGQIVKKEEEKSLLLYQINYEEIKKYDVGKKVNAGFSNQQKMAAHKPLLADLIDAAEAYWKGRKTAPVFYNIETKCNPKTDGTHHPAPEEFVETLMAVIDQKKIAGRVIIQSFDFRTLQVLNQKYPHIRTAALVSDNKGLEAHLQQLGFKPTIYSPHYTLVKPELVQQCHEKKIKVLPWTVNTKSGIDSLKAMGVDGIISDYPNLFNEN